LEEYNVGRLNAGALTRQNGGIWENTPGDGVGQVRRDCKNQKIYIPSTTLPVLTDGRRWAIFDSARFVNNANNALTKPVPSEWITEVDLNDSDFCQKIIQQLRP
jgi:hypothetical protein